MEIANIYTAPGESMPGGGEHKIVLRSGDRVSALYYKMPPSPEKDVMDGAHAHRSESVYFVIDGELEVSVAGERTTLKKGDAMLIPFNVILGGKVISKTPAEVLIVASPNNVRNPSPEHRD